MKKKRLFKRNLFKKGIILSQVDNNTRQYALFSNENQMLTKKQMECCRVVIRREIKKRKFLKIVPSTQIPLTEKATGVRMGKGKGPIKDYQAQLKIGSCIAIFDSNHLKTALKVLHKVSYKLPQQIYLYCRSNHRKYFIR